MTREEKTRLGAKLYHMLHPQRNFYASKATKLYADVAEQFINYLEKEKYDER